MNAVDTNVFVYALDDTEMAKQAKAQELIGGLVQPRVQTVMLLQVAGELLSCLRKWESAGRITPADVERHFRDTLALFPLKAPSAKVFEIAFGLHGRFSLSHWDSMLCRLQGGRCHYALFGRYGYGYGLRRPHPGESVCVSDGEPLCLRN